MVMFRLPQQRTATTRNTVQKKKSSKDHTKPQLFNLPEPLGLDLVSDIQGKENHEW